MIIVAIERLSSVLGALSGKMHRAFVVKGYSAVHTFLETCPFAAYVCVLITSHDGIFNREGHQSQVPDSFICSIQSRVQKRWKEELAGRKSFIPFIQSSDPGFKDSEYRNIGILLEEVLNELLLEIIAACDGLRVTAFQVDAILLDESVFATYCGLHEVFIDFTANIASFFTQFPASRSFYQYVRKVIADMNALLTPFSAKVPHLRDDFCP